ncbi:MAG: sulfur carrier protein ThiS [Planctomycetota bacterium]|nr:sulfur carrier protein ThiS [Planctomycetota bacterium]
MSESITIQFNGQTLDVLAGTTVTELLHQAEIRSKLVAVEINQEIVPHEEHAVHQISAGDIIEAVTLVGGG